MKAGSAGGCSLAPYRRPFRHDEIIGGLAWTAQLVRRFSGAFYHACHWREAEAICDKRELDTSGTWDYSVACARHKCSARGVWCGLNEFNGNHYGPLVFTIPPRALVRRRFWIISRDDDDRTRWFLVEYNAHVSFFMKRHPKQIDPSRLFANHSGRLERRPNDIYDVVLTTPLSLVEPPYHLRGVQHRRCIGHRCGGSCVASAKGLVTKLRRRFPGFVTVPPP